MMKVVDVVQLLVQSMAEMKAEIGELRDENRQLSARLTATEALLAGEADMEVDPVALAALSTGAGEAPKSQKPAAPRAPRTQLSSAEKDQDDKARYQRDHRARLRLERDSGCPRDACRAAWKATDGLTSRKARLAQALAILKGGAAPSKPVDEPEHAAKPGPHAPRPVPVAASVPMPKTHVEKVEEISMGDEAGDETGELVDPEL